MPLNELRGPRIIDGTSPLAQGEQVGSRLTPTDHDLAARTAEMLPSLMQRLDLGRIAAISYGLEGNYHMAGALLTGTPRKNARMYYNDEADDARSFGLANSSQLVTHGLVAGIILPSDLPIVVKAGTPPGFQEMAESLIHGRLTGVNETTLQQARVNSASALAARRILDLDREFDWLQQMREAVALQAGLDEPINGHPASRYHLRPRELEVLQLIAHSKSPQEIAELLFIAEKTVKSGVSAVLRKLKLDKRVRAIHTGVQEGIIHINIDYPPAPQTAAEDSPDLLGTE